MRKLSSYIPRVYYCRDIVLVFIGDWEIRIPRLFGGGDSR